MNFERNGLPGSLALPVGRTLLSNPRYPQFDPKKSESYLNLNQSIRRNPEKMCTNMTDTDSDSWIR